MTAEAKQEPIVKLVEWFDDHWYKIVIGEKTDYFPSTSTKLRVVGKPFLAKWRGDIGNREADMRMFEAGERGTRIHHAWYTLTTGGAVIFNPWQRPNYLQEDILKLQDENCGNVAVIQYQDEMIDIWKLQRWVEIVKPKFLGSEMTVYSLKNREAGTMDNLMEIQPGEYAINGKTPLKLDGGIYVLDLKTGNNVDDDAYMQTADYAYCKEEMNPEIKIAGTIILHTGSQVRTGIEGLATLVHNREEIDKDYQDFRHAAALWERKNASAKPKVFEFPSLLKLGGVK
jgi:hypothetical protein